VLVFGPGLRRRTSDEDLALAVRLDDELQDLKLGCVPRLSHPDPSAGSGDRRRPVPCLVREEGFVAAELPSAIPADLHDLTTPAPRSQRRGPSQSSTNPRHTRRRSRWAPATTASRTSS
jgi:hypothetical protein